MFDLLVAETAGARGAAAVQAWARVENAACARRLSAMVAMLDTAYAADGSADREQWCVDNFEAVAAHIAAVQRVTTGTAENLLFLAAALHEQFPKVAAVFADGLITLSLVRIIIARTRLAIVPDARHQIDDALAAAMRDWEPRSKAKTEQFVDAIIEQFDPNAVQRTQTKARGRSVDVAIEDGTGLATLYATLFAPDAVAMDARLSELADTVCPNDPRTKKQRRADAMGALARNADRLTCLCDSETCPAATEPPRSGVVVYVVAHHDTVHGPESMPDPTPTPTEPTDESGEKGYTAEALASIDVDVDDAADGSKAADVSGADSDCTALDGVAPPLFTKPLRELTLAEALTPPPPGPPATIRPAALMGGQFLPGSIGRRAALNATLVPIVHPGQAPPETHYRPSKKLLDFVRSRDLTCRFPGCTKPATDPYVDVDHTIAWPHGPTTASNLKCLCRHHHLLKTFWVGPGGWQDEQLPDGTVIWTAPDARTHTTVPGSRLLFPELSAPTAPVTTTDRPASQSAGQRMPRRKSTRADDRLRRILRERELNQALREAEAKTSAPEPKPLETTDPEPAPPF